MRLLPVARIQREPAHSYFRIGHNPGATFIPAHCRVLESQRKRLKHLAGAVSN